MSDVWQPRFDVRHHPHRRGRRSRRTALRLREADRRRWRGRRVGSSCHIRRGVDRPRWRGPTSTCPTA